MIPTDEIIAMAKECGTLLYDSNLAVFDLDQNQLTAFANLVSARAAKGEREACAQVCLEISKDKWAEYNGRKPYPKDNPNRANPHTEGISDGAEDCAFAIRARGESA